MARLRFPKFPLGFYACYPYDITGLTESEVAGMAECGMTLVMSPRTDHTYVAETLKALDLFEKYDIKVVLSDTRSHWKGVLRGGDEYRAAMRQAYADYGHHPAVFGFFLGDEPEESELKDCGTAFKIALEEAPGLVPYLNQNPGYAEKCAEFTKDSGCGLVSFDRYTQLTPDEDAADGFVQDLTEYKRLADAVDAPMLAIMLSVGHFRYRVPSEDDFRWQMGVALACGTNAVFWFTYHTPAQHSNYRTAPISEFGDRTQTFYALKAVQRRFNRDHADLLNHCDFGGVCSVDRHFAHVPAFDPADNRAKAQQLLGVKSDHNTPALVTYLEGRDQYAGKKYLMLTNNTPNTSDLFRLCLAKTVRQTWQVFSDHEVDFVKFHHDAFYDFFDDRVECSFYLAPGQFEIFRFE